uniref:disrupted in schizophrenia 1 protein n=1 Tax=Myxine glutinosa TaxID=7769 RepID=UPI0035901FD5
MSTLPHVNEQPSEEGEFIEEPPKHHVSWSSPDPGDPEVHLHDTNRVALPPRLLQFPARRDAVENGVECDGRWKTKQEENNNVPGKWSRSCPGVDRGCCPSLALFNVPVADLTNGVEESRAQHSHNAQSTGESCVAEYPGWVNRNLSDDCSDLETDSSSVSGHSKTFNWGPMHTSPGCQPLPLGKPQQSRCCPNLSPVSSFGQATTSAVELEKDDSESARLHPNVATRPPLCFINNTLDVLGKSQRQSIDEKVLEKQLSECERHIQLRLSLREFWKEQTKATDEGNFKKAHELDKKMEDLMHHLAASQFPIHFREPPRSNPLQNGWGEMTPQSTQGNRRLKNDEESFTSEDVTVAMRSDKHCKQGDLDEGEVLALQQHLGNMELVERRLSMTSLSCGSPWWDRSHLYHSFPLDEQMEASRKQLEKAIGAPYDVKSLKEEEFSLRLGLQDLSIKFSSKQDLVFTLEQKIENLGIHLRTLEATRSIALSGGDQAWARRLGGELGRLAAEQDACGQQLAAAKHATRLLAKDVRLMQREHSALRERLYNCFVQHDESILHSARSYMVFLEAFLKSPCRPDLTQVWEADLVACQLLYQSLGQTISPHHEDGMQPENVRSLVSMAMQDLRTSRPLEHSPCSQNGNDEMLRFCDGVGERLLHLERELEYAMQTRDATIVERLQTELLAVRMLLQDLLVQL